MENVDDAVTMESEIKLEPADVPHIDNIPAAASDVLDDSVVDYGSDDEQASMHLVSLRLSFIARLACLGMLSDLRWRLGLASVSF